MGRITKLSGLCALNVHKMRSNTVGNTGAVRRRGTILAGILGSRHSLLAGCMGGSIARIPRIFVPCGRILSICRTKLRIPSRIALV